MKIVYVLTGIPGCGKTTWANNFKKNHPRTFVISSDDIRYEIGGAYQYFKEEERVWNIFFTRANKIALTEADFNLVLDSTCLTNFKRKNFLLRLTGFDKKILVYFDIPKEVCIERNKEHVLGKVVLDEVIEKMSHTFETPNREVTSLFDEIVVVN